MRNFICLLSICIATLSGPTAIAADFKWTRSPDGRDGNGVITVRGTIEPGDHQKLIAALGDNEPAAALPIYVDLRSEGGNFEEAIRIMRVMEEKRLSAPISSNARCLSACALVFMAGRSMNNTFLLKHRVMHPTATLGFHAPTISPAGGGGNFDAADLSSAYSRAVEQIGSKLLAVAKFREESRENPQMKPGLINEMMFKSGNNFFYIDTIGKAAEFEIDLLDVPGPRKIDAASRINACSNAISAIVDSYIAADARQYWLSGPGSQRPGKERGSIVFSFEGNRFKGRYCDPTVRKDDPSIVVAVGIAGADRQTVVEPWFYWPADRKLAEFR